MITLRAIHALTDLCLGALFGISIGVSVAASVIFGVSREQGFDKHIANTLAGATFDRLGWPVLILACLAAAGCIVAALRPPGRARAFKLMACAAVLMVACAAVTQLHFAPRMKHLRETAIWVNGELVNPAEKAEFGHTHGLAFGVAALATLIAGGVLVTRRWLSPFGDLGP